MKNILSQLLTTVKLPSTEDIFDSEPGSPLYSFISKNYSGEILDLGCNIPKVFYELYHLFGSSKFTGVELLKSEWECIKECQRRFGSKAPQLRAYSSFFDIYVSNFTWDDKYLHKQIDNKALHDLLFVHPINFGTDIFKFLRKNQTNFSIIIASNSLHFTQDFNQFKWSLEHIKRAQKEDHLTYIRLEYYEVSKDRHAFRSREKVMRAIEDVLGSGYFYLETIDEVDWKIGYSNMSLPIH